MNTDWNPGQSSRKRLNLFSLLSLVVAVVVMSMIMKSSSASVMPTADWKFEVLLNEKEIGYHTFSLIDDGRQQRLETEARFDVRFLFITAFRYRHTDTEIWSDGCLESIDAVTESNGKVLKVRGERRDDGFELAGEAGSTRLDRCVQTFAYWNPNILSAEQLLNSQTGEYEDVAVTVEGADTVLVNDRPVDALRYRLATKGGDISLWYSNDEPKRWLALEAPAKGGRTIRYQPVQVPSVENTILRLARTD